MCTNENGEIKPGDRLTNGFAGFDQDQHIYAKARNNWSTFRPWKLSFHRVLPEWSRRPLITNLISPGWHGNKYFIVLNKIVWMSLRSNFPYTFRAVSGKTFPLETHIQHALVPLYDTSMIEPALPIRDEPVPERARAPRQSNWTDLHSHFAIKSRFDRVVKEPSSAISNVN